MRRGQIQPGRGHSSRQGALEGLQTAESRTERRAEMKRPAEDELDGLIGRLRDPQYCSKYLSAAFRDSAGTFLVALRNVARAQKGMSKLAAEAGVNRENLYRTLSEEGNPRLDTLWAVLKATGLRVSLEPASAATATQPTLEHLRLANGGARLLDRVRASAEPTARMIGAVEAVFSKEALAGTNAGAAAGFIDLHDRFGRAAEDRLRERMIGDSGNLQIAGQQPLWDLLLAGQAGIATARCSSLLPTGRSTGTR